MGEWGSFGECNNQTGTRTRTRQVITQPLNGGAVCGGATETQNCPIDCEVGSWVVSGCDSNGNRTKNRQVITVPKNGGVVCPVLTETNPDGSCFEKEMCGKIVTSLGINSQGDLQNKIYSQDANVQVWEGYNCSITDRPTSGIPNDKLCKYADDWSNSTDRNYYKKIDGSRRAKILIKCPGTLLDEGEFIGAGSTSGNFFTITVADVRGNNSQLNLQQNIGKKIRIWYGPDGYPTGWAFSKDWVYPEQFIRNNKTLSDLGSIDYTSALEIIDKRIGTSYGYKFLLWFIGTFPPENGVPSNNPREAVKWISINKPSTTLMDFGGDAGTFLGTQRFRGYFTYGSGSLNAAAVNQYVRTNKYDNYNNYMRTMSIKL
jgi:hypothetical protein